MFALPILRRSMVGMLFMVMLSGCWISYAVAEIPLEGQGRETSVTSPETLPQALNAGAEILKKTNQDLQKQVEEQASALAKMDKFLAELKVAVATLKASLAVKGVSPSQVEGVLKYFALRQETVKNQMTEWEKTIERVSKEQAALSASRETLAQEIRNLRGMDEEAVRSPEMEKAYEEYVQLAKTRMDLIDRLLQTTRESLQRTSASKELLDGIQPQLKSLDEGWKVEITKRETRLSVVEQMVRVLHAFLALPERAQGWLDRMSGSGVIRRFIEDNLPLLLGLLLIIILIGWVSRWLPRIFGRRIQEWRMQTEVVSLRTVWGLCEILLRSLFPIGFALWLGLGFYALGLLKVNSAWLILFGLAAVVAILLSNRAVKAFFTRREAGGLLPFDAVTARFYRRYLKLLAVYLFGGGFALYSTVALGFPEASQAFLEHLFRFVLQVWVLWLLRPSKLDKLFGAIHDWDATVWLEGTNIFRRLVMFLLIVVGLSDLLGFQGMAAYVVKRMAYSEGVIVCWALLTLGAKVMLHFLFHPEDGCVPRRVENQANLWRRFYGIADRVIGIFLTVAAGLGVLLAWGVTAGNLKLVLNSLTWGFDLGPVRITTLNLGLVILVIYLVGWSTRLSHNLLETRVLPRTGWDSGIQYTVSAVVRYSILFLGGLVALNVVGFPLSNLALVAGALGVGVGFGLQDIVKNFVSGLILLFERPIKVGDMLVIDGQWGEVMAIRMRSTVFQTYDKYVLIIPNSDMVSSKILNWTHFGRKPNRLTLKVGVSYDSDVRQVTRVITDVCKENPRVLDNPAPQIYFSAYGDSSLDFTIWVHVRLPDDRIPATHELNSAIFEAFRENSIEIPFPQRDLHVRSWVEPPATPENAK